MNIIESGVQLPQAKLLIDGEWVDAASGETFATLNPATEEIIATVASAGTEDAARAVKAARVAFEDGPWSVMRASASTSSGSPVGSGPNMSRSSVR